MDNTFVGIVIGVKTAGFAALSGDITRLNRLSESLANAGKNVTKLNEKIAKISGLKLKVDENLSKIGGELGKWQSRLATAASFALPVKLAVDFESSMADVKKYVEFKSEDEVKVLSEQIKSLSRELGVNANELAQISASGGQLGLKSDEIAGFTKLVSKMGVAFDMSGKDAGDAIALTMNNLRLSIDEIAILGDKINYLDDKMSMVNARDIINVIGRTAGSGSILGLKGDKISALASSFLSLGKAPEVASTAMNSLFGKLANIDGQGEKFAKALERMGMSAEDLKAAIQKDAAAGLDAFLQALAKVDKKAQMGVLTDLFGAQFADDIGTLVSNIDQYKKANELINDKGASGSMDEALKAKLATTKSGLERLSQSFINLGITIGEAFLPTLNLAVFGLSKMGNAVTAFTQTYPNFSKVLFGIVGGLLAVVTVAPMFKILWWGAKAVWQHIKILSTAIGFLTDVTKLQYLSALRLNAAYLITQTRLKAVVAATWVSNTASKAYAATMGILRGGILAGASAMKILRLALISTGIGAIVVALGAAVAYVITHWDEAKAFFVNFWEKIKPLWQAAKDWIADIFGGLANWFVGIWQSVAGFFGGIWADIKGAVASVAEFFEPIFSPVINFFIGAWSYIKDEFMLAWDAIKQYFAPMTQFFTDIAASISGAFDWVIELWRNAFGGFFDWIGEKFSFISSAISSVTDGIGKAWSGTKSFLGFGDEENEIAEKEQGKQDIASKDKTEEKKDGGFFSFLGFGGGDEKQAKSAPQSLSATTPNKQNLAPTATPALAQNSNITLNFNGGISVATDNGVFDMNEFERQVASSVKRALKTDERNAANRSVIGQ